MAADPSRSDDSLAQDYLERLRVPLRWWAVATMFWASVLLAFLVALPVGVAFATAGGFTALNALVFVTYGAARVEVSDEHFRAGRAQIPVGMLADPEALDATATRRVAGVEADARAYLLLRPYVQLSVRVRVVDPADPAPYWLVATRHPSTLSAALTAAINRAAPAAGG